MHENKAGLDVDFQRAIIRVSAEIPDWLATNRPFVFTDSMDTPELAHILKQTLDFFDKYDTAPDFSVLTKLVLKDTKGTFRHALIEELKAVISSEVTPSRVTYITESIQTFALQTLYRRTIISAAEAIEDGNLKSIQTLFDKALTFGELSKPNDLFLFDENSIQQRVGDADDVGSRIPTLFHAIDAHTKGGPSRKELWMLMSPPSRGKSMGLINLAANALFIRKNILYVTVEMSKEKVARRFDRRLTGMTTGEIIRNKDKFIKHMTSFRNLYKGNLVITEYPSRSVTVADIGAHIKLLSRRYNFHTDMLVLDYVDELRRPRNEKETYAIGEVISELRGLSVRNNILVWTATQTTRLGFMKTVLDMDDVADSWDKAKIADGMIAICQTKEEEADSIMRWVFIKNRDNKKYLKPIFMKTDFDKSLIREAAQPALL